MLIIIKGQSHKARSHYELSLEQLIALEDETTALGKPLNAGVMTEMFETIEAITHPDKVEQGRLRGRHPLAQWTFAINMFCAMRVDGTVTKFAEILDLTPLDVSFEREPGDPEELEALGVPLAPDPTRRPKPTPKGSGQAAKKRAATTQAMKSAQSKSRKASTAGSHS